MVDTKISPVKIDSLLYHMEGKSTISRNAPRERGDGKALAVKAGTFLLLGGNYCAPFTTLWIPGGESSLEFSEKRISV